MKNLTFQRIKVEKNNKRMDKFKIKDVSKISILIHFLSAFLLLIFRFFFFKQMDMSK